MDERIARERVQKYEREKIRKILLKERDWFETKLKKTTSLLQEELKEPFSLKTHEADINNPAPVSINGTRGSNLQKCIVKIDQALERVEQDKYGFCVLCGDPIPLGRLIAIPFTEFCTPCKNEKNHT